MRLLKQIRIDLGYSQTKMAKVLGLPPQAITRVEKSDHFTLTVRQWFKLLKHLGLKNIKNKVTKEKKIIYTIDDFIKDAPEVHRVKK